MITSLVLLAAAAVTVTPMPPPTPAEAAFTIACHLSHYNCDGVPVPKIVIAPMANLYGRYRIGDDYILLNEKVPEKLAAAVVVHEMVHYLQYKNGAWKETVDGKCAMEKEAFEVSNTFLHLIGEDAYAADWTTWKAWYGCP